MKKLMLTILLTIFSSSLLAEIYTAKGKIVDVLMGAGLSGKAVFYVENFSEAGSCPVHGGANLVVISVPDSENFNSFLSMALMSYTTEKEVKIEIDDQQIDQHGRCKLTRFRLNKAF